MNKNFIAFFIFSQLLTFCMETTAQVTGKIAAENTHEIASIRSDFFIQSVLDQRSGPDSAGLVFIRSDGKNSTQKIALQSATLTGIIKFFTKSNSINTSRRPLRVRIQECNIRETLSGDRVLGQATVMLVFDLIKDSASIPLTQYQSTARYNRPLKDLRIAELTLGRLLNNSLKFIDSWMETEARRNPHLARGVSLTFRDYRDQHDDTVYYTPMRPLVWDDFREKRSDSKFAASVFPSFGYDQATKIDNGIIHVELALKVFVVKSASWVGPGTRSHYNLEHEQKHFDLVRLIAERFKLKLVSENLTPDNFQGIINFEYLEFYREMNRIQREYDEQTSHGLSPVAQETWNRKIETELKLLDL
ncbi:MAG: hypothetical protein WBJ10_10285 [Daejeonella sp.]